MRTAPAVLVFCIALSACSSMQRSSTASQAQVEMVGMSKADLLACAGVPARQERVDDLEFLTYTGGGDSTSVATAISRSTAVGKTYQRYCEATFVLTDGWIERVNYSGRTGGLLTRGEQCAFIVENCVNG